jgi:hypothetical protein
LSQSQNHPRILIQDLHPRSYAHIGSIEEDTHDRQGTGNSDRTDNPQGNFSVCHDLNLLVKEVAGKENPHHKDQQETQV